jgi:purine nucleosidase
MHDIEILGITCVAGNGTLEHVVKCAQLTMKICGNTEIPIYQGLEPFQKGEEVSEYFWGPDGFGNTLNEYE